MATIPAHFEPFSVSVFDQLLEVRELCFVDQGLAAECVERLVHPRATHLPAICGVQRHAELASGSAEGGTDRQHLLPSTPRLL